MNSKIEIVDNKIDNQDCKISKIMKFLQFEQENYEVLKEAQIQLLDDDSDQFKSVDQLVNISDESVKVDDDVIEIHPEDDNVENLKQEIELVENTVTSIGKASSSSPSLSSSLDTPLKEENDYDTSSETKTKPKVIDAFGASSRESIYSCKHGISRINKTGKCKTCLVIKWRR